MAFSSDGAQEGFSPSEDPSACCELNGEARMNRQFAIFSFDGTFRVSEGLGCLGRKINLSTCPNVTGVAQSRRFEDLGVAVLVLSEHVNRDFTLLRQASRKPRGPGVPIRTSASMS
jgi:hypothetical protein